MKKLVIPSALARRAAVAVAIVVACLGALFGAANAASAVPCRPIDCNPSPPHNPTPPTPYYYVDASPLAVHAGQTQPVVKYGAEHVQTTVHVRYEIQRSTGQPVAAWVVSDYHIWNDYAFQGWHVTVNENVYNGNGRLVAQTNANTYGVTPTAFDAADASIYPEALTPITVPVAQSLSDFQANDTFSN